MQGFDAMPDVGVEIGTHQIRIGIVSILFCRWTPTCIIEAYTMMPMETVTTASTAVYLDNCKAPAHVTIDMLFGVV
jgi:hypothetical protein